METKERRAASPDYVCIRFSRAPESLAEEPEVCENCAFWEAGFCVREAQREGGAS